MNIPRRVVTGHDAAGKAVVSMDGAPSVIVTNPLQPGLAFFEIWNTDATPAPVDNRDDPTKGRPVATRPPKGGTIIRFVDVPPESAGGPDLDPESAKKLFLSVDLETVSSPHTKNRHPLMHRTESIDYGIVMWGECWLVLDDSEVHLKAGDVVVQRGTIHAWSNRTNEPCRMAFILVDGTYDETIRQLL
jgi:hypothetical protein